jgi:hypothetical protein
MGCEVFEVGLFKPSATGKDPLMLPRTWDTETLLRSIAWLKHQNREGRNIYIRPRGEHDLSLVDDLKLEQVRAMRDSDFAPACVVQTSPGNFQAWVKHPEALSKEVSTAAARELAARFGGDRGAADWRHFGRLAGFTNRKEKYRGENGLYPFVLLIEHSGLSYTAGVPFVAEIRSRLEADQAQRQRLARATSARAADPSSLKPIEAFRNDPRYGGDGTRVDLAYAIYAFSHGLDPQAVSAALRSRDLAHKGNERRQDDYIDRTVRKAQSAIRGDDRTRTR